MNKARIADALERLAEAEEDRNRLLNLPSRVATALEKNNAIQAETLAYIRLRDNQLAAERAQERAERAKEIADRKAESEAQMETLGRFSGAITEAAGTVLSVETPQGDTLASRLGRCGVADGFGHTCGRERGHLGRHVTASGMVGWQ